MRDLDTGYAASVDAIDKAAWHELIPLFDDASLYQTWSYGALSWGDRSLSHLVLKKDDRIVALAQLRIVRLPVLGGGVAYLVGGPMWTRADEPADPARLRNVLRTLHAEYVRRRGLVLQILPRALGDPEGTVKRLFESEGFAWAPDGQRTLFVDLSRSLEDIEMSTRRKWRQTLHRAQKQNIVIEEGTQAGAYEAAVQIIEEMKARKRYVEYGDMKRMVAVHQDLPEALRLKIFVCRHEGSPAAVLGWLPVGKTGLPLIAATANRGLETNASYPLWWKMIEYYKERGFARCDLGGVNPERNPGGYTFKAGLAGEGCEPNDYIGQFEACENPVSAFAVRTGLLMRSTARKARLALNARVNRLRGRRNGRHR
jgi:hypothetical protein